MRAPDRVRRFLPLALVIALAFFIVPAVAGSAQQALAAPPYTLIYYDGHMHTTRSDGSGTVADIKATALARGLSAVIVTDHCNMLTLDEWNSLVAETAALSDGSFLALAGVEITGSEGMFNRGHFNALNISDPFVGDDVDELCPEEVWPDPPNPAGTGPMYPENLTEWVDYVHDQGGIAVHNHTSGSTSLDYGVDAIEVYNQSHVDDVFGYAKMMGYTDEEAMGFAITLNNLNIYGERDINMLVPFPGFPDPIPLRLALYYATLNFSGVGQWLGAPEAPLNSWDELLMAYVDGTVAEPIFGVANSDAHHTGDPESEVGLAKTGLYVMALTPEEIYEAIEAGRGFATTGPSLDFDVNSRLMGETANVRSGGTAKLDLSVNAEIPGTVLVKIDIVKNGVVLETISPMSPTYNVSRFDTVTEDGYYRVEVTSLDPSSGAYHFAYSNPVFVSTAPAAVGGTLDIQVESAGPFLGSADDGSAGWPVPYGLVLAGALAAGATVVGLSAWYARRRWAK